jgi:RHS repeat-associated protein
MRAWTGSIVWPRVAACVVLVGLVFGGAIASAAGEGSPAGHLPNFRDPVSQALLAQGVAAAKLDEQRRATLTAGLDRQRSRTAYAGLSAVDAMAADRRLHPTVLARSPFRSLRLGTGERVERFAGTFAAVLTNSSGKQELLEAGLPLRSTVASGDPGPVDLTLSRQASGFVPANPLVRTSVPLNAAGALSFAGRGYSVRLVGAQSADGSNGGEAMVAYPNALTDSDLLLEPTATGAEVSVMLRSAQSPEQVSFDFELAAGVHLAASAGRVRVMRGAEVVAVIDAPFAYDADKVSVPVSVAVAGSRVTFSVSHRSKDLAYPLLLDPVIDNYQVDGNGSYNGPPAGSADPFGGWGFYNNNNDAGGQPLFFGFVATDGLGSGPHIGSRVAYFDDSSYAEWYWYVRHQSPSTNSPVYITQADFETANFNAVDGNAYLCGTTGIYDQVHLGYVPATITKADGSTRPSPNNATCVAYPYSRETHVPTLSAPHGKHGDTAYFAGVMKGNGSRAFIGATVMRSAQIRSTDDNDPVFDSFNSGLSAGWTQLATPTAIAQATDTGLGMQRLELAAPGAATQVRLADVQNRPGVSPCAGDHVSPCPDSLAVGGAGQAAGFSYSTAPMPEGVNTVTLSAWDVINHHTTTTWTVKVDRSDPALTLSGALKTAADQGGWVKAGPIALRVDSSDRGLANEQRSGVKSVQLVLDNASYGGPHTNTCASGDCPATAGDDFSIDASALTAGSHTLQAVVTDGVGRSKTSETLTFKVDATPPDLRLSGSLKDNEYTDVSHTNVIGLLHDEYQLVSDATDGSDAAPQSGVKRIEVFVNDVSQAVEEQSCPKGSCRLSSNYTFRRSDHPLGDLTIKVVATDIAGNQTTQSFHVLNGTSLLTPSDRRGLERWMGFETIKTGIGSTANVNLSSGNLAWTWTPIELAGRGLSTFVRLTYNANEHFPLESDLTYRPVGRGMSIQIDAPTRLNEPLQLAGQYSGLIGMIDGDGTQHLFTTSPGSDKFQAPPGVHLRLRRHSEGDIYFSKEWLLTRPDGVTYAYDATGYISSIEDRHGNTTRFVYEAVPSLRTATLKRVTKVIDPAGRELTISYDTAVSQNPDTITAITDHAGRVTRFYYDNAGNLNRVHQGEAAPGFAAADRDLKFEYTSGDGDMVAVIDPQGQRTEIGYAGLYQDRKVYTIKNRAGHTTHFTYGQSSNLATASYTATVQDDRDVANGVQTVYTLDARGRITRVVDARNTVDTMAWSADNMLLAHTKAAGTGDEATTRMTYLSPSGRLSSVTDPNGHRTELSYHEFEGTITSARGLDAGERFVADLTAIRDARGNTTKFEVQDNGDVVKRFAPGVSTPATTDYTSFGEIKKKVTEVGDTTTYSDFDANGQPQTMVDARQNANEPGYDGTWHYRYDPVGNLLAVTDPRGGAIAGGPDDPFTTTFGYDALDRRLSVRSPRDSGVGGVAPTFVDHATVYDANDNITALTDATGKQWLASYTPMDLSRKLVAPSTAHSNGAGAQVTAFGYDAAGALVARTNPNAALDPNAGTGPDGDASASDPYSTQWTLDAIGQPTVEKRRSATGTDLRTSYAYDRRGNVVGIADPKHNASGVTDAGVSANQRWSFGYDKADNRNTTIEDPAGLKLTTLFGYDETDQLTSVVSPRAQFPRAPGDTMMTTDSLTTSYGYDNRGLLESMTVPARGTTQIDRRADGRVKAVTTPRGTESAATGDFTTSYTYFATGELKSRSIPWAQGQYGPRDWQVSYDRNAVGDPVTITDARGHNITNTFFDSGQLKTTSRPSWWTYDPQGAERKALQSAGIPLDSTSSHDSWLAGLQLGPMSDNPTGLAVRERTDTERATAHQGGTPKPSSESAGNFGAVNAQPLAGLLPDAGSTTLSYDPEMRLHTITDVAGHDTTLGRDAVGRLTSLSQPFKTGDPITQAFAWDRNNNLTDQTNGDAGHTQLSYDQSDRLTDVKAPSETSVAPSELTQMTLDANGNTTATKTPRVGDFTWHATFDAADRATSRTNPAGDTTAWKYDAAGNTTTEFRPRALPTAALGTASGDDTFASQSVYDANNQLVAVTDKPNGTTARQTSHEYDADGNLTKTISPGAAATPSGGTQPQVSETQYDGRGLPWKQTEGTGADARTTLREFDANSNLRRVVQPAGVDETTKQPAIAGDFSDDSPTGYTVAIAANRNATIYDHSVDDLVKRVYQPVNDSGASDQRRFSMDITRDTLGRPEQLADFHQLAPTSEDPAVTQRSFFDNGWIKSQTAPKLVDPDSHAQLPFYRAVDYGYDHRGNQISWTTRLHPDDNSGRRVVRAFAPNGVLDSRQAQVLDSAGNAVGGQTRAYSYNYNENHSLESFTDVQKGRITNISYDGAERVKVVNDPAGGDTTFCYDHDGNVTRRETDGRIGGPIADHGCDTTDYSGLNAKTTTFAYDHVDRELTTIVNPGTGSPRTTSSAYYPSDAVATRTKSNTVVERWFYDSRGEPIRSQRDRQGATVKNQVYSYDRNTNRTTDERGTYNYDARNQLTSWTRDPDQPHPGATVTYVHNGTGAVTRKTDSAGPDTTSVFAGDRLVRTSTSDQGTTVTDYYAYDEFGNVTTITRDQPVTGSFNPCTDTPPSGGIAYCYDAFERLTRSKGPDQDPQTSYTYDALDRRDSRTRQGTSYDYAYLGLTRRLSLEQQPLTANEPAALKSYDYDSHLRRLGQTYADPSGANPEHRVYSTDAAGNVENLESSSGYQIGIYRYDPYGQLTRSDPGDPETVLSDPAKQNPFRFEGFYYDRATGAYDMQARQYRPDQGRFLTQDSYEAANADLQLQGDPLTQDRYAFAAGNPISNIEYDGHEGKTSNRCDSINTQNCGPSDRQEGLNKRPHRNYTEHVTGSGASEGNGATISSGLGSTLSGGTTLTGPPPRTGADPTGGGTLGSSGTGRTVASAIREPSFFTQLLNLATSFATGTVDSFVAAGGTALDYAECARSPFTCNPPSPEETINLAINVASVTGIGFLARGALAIRAAQGASELPALAGGSQLEDLLATGRAVDPADAGGELSRAGRAYAKHSNLFRAVSGGPKALNAAGEGALEDILGNPKTIEGTMRGGNFAGGAVHVAPNGIGAVFSPEGVFQYFGRFPYP